MYNPKPIDTSEIKLSEDIMELGEIIAKNVHDQWATNRIKQGWKYGLKRDEVKKEHPCLIEYDKLSEEEKEYDRITAFETLKLIKKLGYEIKKSVNKTQKN